MVWQQLTVAKKDQIPKNSVQCIYGFVREICFFKFVFSFSFVFVLWLLTLLLATLLNLFTSVRFPKQSILTFEYENPSINFYHMIFSTHVASIDQQKRSVPNPSMLTQLSNMYLHQFIFVMFFLSWLFCLCSLNSCCFFPLQTDGSSACPSKDPWGREGGFWCKT